MSQTLTTHISLDDRGVAWIDDSNVKVIEVALDKIAHGLSPEEICDQHDGYLSMSQIHAALMHYYLCNEWEHPPTKSAAPHDLST